MTAKVIDLAKASAKLRRADEKRDAYITRRALEMLRNGVKLKGDETGTPSPSATE